MVTVYGFDLIFESKSLNLASNGLEELGPDILSCFGDFEGLTLYGDAMINLLQTGEI